MHISELLAEQQLDELSLAGVGQGIGKVANTVGKAVGNVQGAYQGAKDAFNQGRTQTTPIAQRNVSRGARRVRTAPATNQQTTTPQVEPQGQAVDLDQVKQQSADQQAQGQANQQQAMQQMQATAQANQTAAVKDAEIKKAADDAKAKPASLQTLADRLAIKLAASKGLHENKKKNKKTVVEFHSKFLGQLI
jgi:hypothetical protein